MFGEGMKSAKSGSGPLNSDGGEGGRKAMNDAWRGRKAEDD